MSYALVANNEYANTSGGTGVASIDSTGADLLVVTISQYSGGGHPTLSDSKGNTWTGLTAKTNGESEVRIYYAKNPTVGGSHTVTYADGSNSPYCEITFAAYSGANTTAPFDVENGSTGSSNSGTPGSITPSEDNELVVTAVCTGGNGTAFSIGSSYTITDTQDYTGGVNEGGGQAYLVQTSAAATNPTWAWTGTCVYGAAIASFKAAAAGGGVFSLQHIYRHVAGIGA